MQYDHQPSPDTVRIRVTQDVMGKPYPHSGRESDGASRPGHPTSDSKRLFQALYDAAIITDLGGNVTDVNERALAFLLSGYDELLNMNLVNVVSGADVALLASLNDNLDRGRYTLVDAYCTRKDGSQFPAEIAVSKIQLGGEPCLCFFVRDITRRKRQEEEQQKLFLQMQHTQKLESLGLLAGGIAHDFNNLLMAVLGNAGLALSDLPYDSPARNNVKEIENISLRAAELCRQLLAYSGKGRFVVEALDLSALVGEMGRMLEVSIPKKITIKQNLAARLPAVEADASQIRQVVMNLITNAADAIGDRAGIIAIATGCQQCDRRYLDDSYLGDQLTEGEYCYIEVADTGCGMDPETKDRIFDPFFTTKFTGRGLGLAAVLGIVRGHHGMIRVHSDPGEGSTFKVLFPASSRQVLEETAEASDLLAWRGTGTVLLVDDEESVRKVGLQMLARAGFHVLPASDGITALNIFKAHAREIVCVVLDLTMPGMDGEETFRELRRIREDVPVIVASGYSEQEIPARFSSGAPAGFLHKPYKAIQLVAMLRKLLERPKPA